MALDDPAQPVVVLLGRRSLSADFYSQGRSPRVMDLQPLVAQWPAQGRCLALNEADRPQVQAAGLSVQEELGRHQHRAVLWVVPAR